jgi:Protein of unknown function (DUF2934)
MEVMPADESKRGRPKAAPAAKPKSVARVRTSRKPSAQAPDPISDPMIVRAEPVDLTDMIATTAYFLAAGRHFMPGRELDDWLEAERRVQALLNG